MNNYHNLKPHSLYVGAGTFDDYGGWVLDTQFIANIGSEYLLAHGLGVPVADASATVSLPRDGAYRLWALTKDWVAPWKPGFGPGRFRVTVGGWESPAIFGTQGSEWGWQDGGVCSLQADEARIKLHDLSGFEGRLAGLFLTQDLDFIPPGDLDESAKLRRVINGQEDEADLGEYDLLVAGAGLAGMCAALMAARRGLKVALVHDRQMAGGNNSSEVRVWLAGETNLAPFTHLGDIMREFEQAKAAHYGPENCAEIYEDEKKMSILRAEPGIGLFMGHFIVGARMCGDSIESAIVYDVKSGAYGKIRARLFADCTGDATLGFLAGAHYETTTNGHMGMTNIWHVDEAENERPFPPCPWAIDLSAADFPGRGDVESVYGQTGPEALGAWFWESGMEHPPIEMAEYARDTNLRAMYGAFDAIKNTDGDYKNFYMKFAAYIGGKRESRRLLGDIVLTKADVMQQISFPDALIPSTWNFDVHYPDRHFYTAFHEGDAFLTKDYHEDFVAPYFIPYRCLYSRNIANLFMAGRDVSVSHDALGSVRVMRTGGLMGEVVGQAAALCIEHGALPRDVYGRYLGELLGWFRG